MTGAPRILSSDAFVIALQDAGVVRAGEFIRRLVIDAQADEAVRLYIERAGDERLLDVIPGLDGITVVTAEPSTTEDQGSGQQQPEKVSGENPRQEYEDALAARACALSEYERTCRMADRARRALDEALATATEAAGGAGVPA